VASLIRSDGVHLTIERLSAGLLAARRAASSYCCSAECRADTITWGLSRLETIRQNPLGKLLSENLGQIP